MARECVFDMCGSSTIYSCLPHNAPPHNATVASQRTDFWASSRCTHNATIVQQVVHAVFSIQSCAPELDTFTCQNPSSSGENRQVLGHRQVLGTFFVYHMQCFCLTDVYTPYNCHVLNTKFKLIFILFLFWKIIHYHRTSYQWWK